MKENDVFNRPQPRSSILTISPYVPGASEAKTSKEIHKLSSNESPLAPSPLAIEAYVSVAHKLATYPIGDSYPLREAIGQRYNLPPKQLMIGNGSDELLSLLANCYLSAGDEAIITEHGFTVYEINIRGAGAKPVKVKEKDCRIDITAIINALSDKTKMVFIANPGNPTGTYLSKDEIKTLHSALPAHVLLVLDGAYAEFVDRTDYATGEFLVHTRENVVMTRTFSKIFALAALRVGWMYAPLSVIDAVNRIRGAFNVNSAAQAAAAAALTDDNFLSNAQEFNHYWRNWLSKQLRMMGLNVTDSVTNFLLIHFDGAGKTAEEVDNYLKMGGFILRRVTSYGFTDSLRLSVGSEVANRGVVAALRKLLA